MMKSGCRVFLMAAFPGMRDEFYEFFINLLTRSDRRVYLSSNLLENNPTNIKEKAAISLFRIEMGKTSVRQKS